MDEACAVALYPICLTFVGVSLTFGAWFLYWACTTGRVSEWLIALGFVPVYTPVLFFIGLGARVARQLRQRAA